MMMDKRDRNGESREKLGKLKKEDDSENRSSARKEGKWNKIAESTQRRVW